MATDGSIQFWKRDLRTEMKRRLRELPKEQYETKSAEICRKAAKRFETANVVAAFASTQWEPNLESLWTHGFFAERAVLYPKVVGGNLLFCRVVSLNDLSIGKFGIRQPTGPTSDLNPEVILVPGLAFTSVGARLGRGGGHYDRFLATAPGTTIKVGICFDFQVLDELPAESHDTRMDLIIFG